MSTPGLPVPLSAKQVRSIVESADARISVWHGAVRSGKTIASLVAFLVAVAEAPPSGLILITGRTLPTIERNIIEPLQDPVLFGRMANQVKHTRGATTANIMGRVVHLIGAADARAEGKLRGLTACLALVDEATLVPEEFFTQLLARLSVPGARCLLTTNPDGPRHWLRQKFLLRESELDLRAWHFRLEDNPALDPAYVDSLKREYTGLWFRRYVEGAWCLAEGAVYDMWDPDRHVVDTLPPIRQWVGVGIDVGTVNPTAALLLALGTDGRAYLAAEYRYDSKVNLRQKTDAEYSADLRTWLGSIRWPDSTLVGVRPQWVVVDPSAASFVQQLHRDGVTSVLADNSVLDGIRTVSNLLARDQLRVHSSCRGFIAEVASYSWDEKAAEKGEDRPIKADDHSLDAARYILHTTYPLWHAHLMREGAGHAVAA